MNKPNKTNRPLQWSELAQLLQVMLPAWKKDPWVYAHNCGHVILAWPANDPSSSKHLSKIKLVQTFFFFIDCKMSSRTCKKVSSVTQVTGPVSQDQILGLLLQRWNLYPWKIHKKAGYSAATDLRKLEEIYVWEETRGVGTWGTRNSHKVWHWFLFTIIPTALIDLKCLSKITSASLS